MGTGGQTDSVVHALEEALDVVVIAALHVLAFALALREFSEEIVAAEGVEMIEPGGRIHLLIDIGEERCRAYAFHSPDHHCFRGKWGQ